ncbi:hypothetical protein Tsubulata_014931 [Turnera subulata]|uniref:U-box domain-containing protein n=1 Tax=Turnera subulata TaxID=218843 RepID=A0A9Q0FYN6_9ROSI|nr:hypothetical protein Tsubulata_014931 [Turnera subulata]
MEDTNIPSYFICPISLEIMKDPVTICTGMTFDRESIQKWMFTYNKTVCPITKQDLTSFTITPNSNLLRLIQSWHLQNTSPSSSSKSAEDDEKCLQDTLAGILEEIKQPQVKVRSLRKMKSLIQENYDTTTGRNYPLGDDNLFPLVASLLNLPSTSAVSISGDDHETLTTIVSTLCLLKPSDETLKKVSENGDGFLIRSLCSIMVQYTSNLQVRIQAVTLLKSIFKVVDDAYKEGIEAEFFESITDILKDQNTKHGSMAALSILREVLPCGKNKELAIKGGSVPVLVELLAESSENRVCEMMLAVLEKLCRKAEGREAFLAHPMGIAAVLSKILRVSHVGNDKAISLFTWVFKSCKSGCVAQEFIEMGGVAKIRLVTEGGCSAKTRDKAKEILGFHLKTWNSSPCFPSSLRANYIVSSP